jgi:type II secretory pathway pseudopilin PulG
MKRVRPAVTLVELLVVLATMLGLLALLLPAVQSARERARQAACQNNLRQLSLATRGYAEVYKRMPPPPPSGKAGGWSVAIMPWMEHAAWSDQLQDVPLTSIPPAIKQRPLTFTCPSASEPEGAIPGIPAAHYVLSASSRRDYWWLADAPIGFPVPWLSSPELPRDQLRTQTGPHNRGTHIANADGSVELHFE